MGMDESSTTPSLVIDSCIWIDLANGIVLEEAFQLPYKIIDPNVLIQEEVRPTNWEKLANLGVNLIPATSDEVAEASRINNAYRSISFYDASALELATRLNGLLLTDDSNLTMAARENSVQVEGIIWLLNEMVTHGCISGSEAIAAMERINQSGHAIHDKEITRLTERWTDF